MNKRRALSAWLPLALATFATLPAHAQSPAVKLKAFVGGRTAKLAAVDRTDSSKLYLLDTEQGDLRKVSDDIEIQSPLFARDGSRVIYDQVGKIHIQPLDGGARTKVVDGSEGHFWYEPTSGEEWIYYTTNTKEQKLRWPDSKGVKTNRRRLSDGTEEHVVDWKADAGPSRDGTHVGAGYATVIIFDLPADAHHLLYDGGAGQGCNPSMSPDDSYLIMHLDLPHDTFSIRNKQDELVWQIDRPDGAEEWQHPEWSTDGDYATATAKEPNGTYSVYVIKLSTQQTLKLLEAGGAEGRDWAFPSLWIEGSVQQVPSLPAPKRPPASDGGAPDAGGGADASVGDAGSGNGSGGCGLAGDGAAVGLGLLWAALGLLGLARRRCAKGAAARDSR